MNYFEKLDAWSRKHHPKWMDILRIFLGCVILWKGYEYIYHRQALYQMVMSSKVPVYSYPFIYYEAFVSLVGGLLIMTGVITRIACAFQLPVAIGNVILYNTASGIFSDNSSGFWLSLIILLLVILFLMEGSGPWSLDRVMRRERNQHPDHWEEELDKMHVQHLWKSDSD